MAIRNAALAVRSAVRLRDPALASSSSLISRCAVRWMSNSQGKPSEEEIARRRAAKMKEEVVLDADGKPLSKSALKRLKKEQERTEANANAAAAAVAVSTETSKSEMSEQDESKLAPHQYRERRLQAVSDWKSHAQNTNATEGAQYNPYPHKFHCSTTVPEFIKDYSHLETKQRLDETVSLSGRVMAKRCSSSKLFFYDIMAEGQTVQLFASQRNQPEWNWELHERLRRGDVVGVKGRPGRSATGELSVIVSELSLLSPCLHILPTLHFGVKDSELRHRQRYLDWMLNPSTMTTFHTRAKIINFVRRFLDARGFLEVETPMMTTLAGGAAARPFVTHHNDLQLDMFMRVAPELYLKQLIIGGFPKVYEIGRNFRNEGIDLTHNPEFTACEFYWAYADYRDIMTLTEEMLSSMVKEITGDYKIKFSYRDTDSNNDNDKDKEVKMKTVEIDFSPPFARVDMMAALEEAAGVKMPEDLASEEANVFLKNLCAQHHIKCPEPQTTTKLLDKLVGHFVEPQMQHPTFLLHHPQLMSPLAKPHRHRSGLSERFELFVMGKELCNAYTELNDPVLQRQRFEEQMVDKAKGDNEAMPIDEDFITALEYGLPPTGGWGLGIDRLTMFLTSHDSIREVLLFPAMKPKTSNT